MPDRYNENRLIFIGIVVGFVIFLVVYPLIWGSFSAKNWIHRITICTLAMALIGVAFGGFAIWGNSRQKDKAWQEKPRYPDESR